MIRYKINENSGEGVLTDTVDIPIFFDIKVTRKDTYSEDATTAVIQLWPHADYADAKQPIVLEVRMPSNTTDFELTEAIKEGACECFVDTKALKSPYKYMTEAIRKRLY